MATFRILFSSVRTDHDVLVLYVYKGLQLLEKALQAQSTHKVTVL